MPSVMLFAVLVLFISATPGQCEDQQAFGGNPIERSDYLWFSAIGEGKDFGQILCSGALISPVHVVTADHCLDDKSINSLRVRVGYYCPRSDNCSRPFHFHGVTEIRRNPSFGDIAILVLSSKAPSIFVPAIPDVGSPSFLAGVKKGGEMLMVGAGHDGKSKKVAKRVETLQLQLKHRSFKKCRNAIRNEKARKQLVAKSIICSVSEEGKPCQGDLGSAILVNGAETSGDVIVAIHTYGPSDCSDADDDLFGHVAVSAVADFVVSVVCVGDRKENWCPSASCQDRSQPLDNTTCIEGCSPFLSAEACAPFCSSSSPSSPTPNLPVLNGDSLQATLLHDLTDHVADVRTVAFDATSSRLASGDTDNIVHLWDPNNGGSPQMTFVLEECCPQSVAFNPSGTTIAVDDGSNVALLDVQNNNNDDHRKLQNHTDFVDGVAWHPDGTMLASGASDKTIKLWDVATGSVLHTLRGHRSGVRAIAFDRQGLHLASASYDDTVRVWDLTTLSHILTKQRHTSWVYSVAFSPDGKRLASASSDETVRVWRASDGSPLGVFSVGSVVNSVAWSPDGQFLVSGTADGIVRIWDANNGGGNALLEMKGHSDWIRSVAWSPNGNWIASCSDDNTVKVWELSTD